MPLVVFELLTVIGNALVKLGKDLETNKDLTPQQQIDLFSSILSDLSKEYFD